jgi:hypothetical protein
MNKPEEKADQFMRLRRADWTDSERAALYFLVERMTLESVITPNESKALLELKANSDQLTADLGICLMLTAAVFQLAQSPNSDPAKFSFWLSEIKKVNPLLGEFIVEILVENVSCNPTGWVQEFNC